MKVRVDCPVMRDDEAQQAVEGHEGWYHVRS
jgi:hypothetical protein